MARNCGLRIGVFGLRIAVALVLLGARAEAAITSLDDVQFWVGDGENRAGLVLDWNGDGTSDVAHAWGFRWSGAAKGEDMLRAVIAADPRLFAKLGSNGGLGVAVRGLGYDLSDDGQFALDDGTQFDADGVAASGPTDGAGAVDADDLYAEGWTITGAWTYGTSNGNPWSGGGWAFSMVGAAGRSLVDGAWDSWAFSPTFRPTAFAANAAPAAPPADFNSDGVVDGADFLTWQRGVGLETSVVRAQGDATGDGVANAADLAAWQAQFRAAHTSPVGAGVPEPHSFTTCASAMFVLINLFRQRKRSAS